MPDTTDIWTIEYAERHVNIHFSPDIMAGRLLQLPTSATPTTRFTITFARVDHEVEDEEIPGVVVSRVNLSPQVHARADRRNAGQLLKWQTREGIKSLPEFGGGRGPRRRSAEYGPDDEA